MAKSNWTEYLGYLLWFLIGSMIALGLFLPRPH